MSTFEYLSDSAAFNQVFAGFNLLSASSRLLLAKVQL